MQTYNLFAATTDAERLAMYARMRSEPGLCRIEPFGAFAATRYADAAAILKDPEVFSSEALTVAAEPPWLGGPNPVAHSIISKDPPKHGRLRALIQRAFGPASMARLEARVRDVSERLAEAAVRQGTVDLVEHFTLAQPRDIIGHMLGLDPSTYGSFRRWAHGIALVTNATTPEQQDDVRSVVREMTRYLNDVIQARRRQPGDDMVSELVQATDADGHQLTDAEVLSFLFLLLPAGMETTMSLLGNALVLLSRFPEQLEQARADKNHLPKFIEEVMRFDSPTPVSFRLAMKDAELSGTHIPAGSLVMGLIGSANWDERVFEQPERFLPGRPRGNQHLSFGYGIHFCVGAQLARMEARLGLEALVSRVKKLRLTTPEVQWAPGLSMHGPAVLPMELEAA